MFSPLVSLDSQREVVRPGAGAVHAPDTIVPESGNQRSLNPHSYVVNNNLN